MDTIGLITVSNFNRNKLMKLSQESIKTPNSNKSSIMDIKQFLFSRIVREI